MSSLPSETNAYYSIIYGYFEIAAREGDIGAGLKGLVPGS